MMNAVIKTTKETQHLYIKIVDGQWYATDLNGKWLTASETAKAIEDGATYEFASAPPAEHITKR